jgi:hypothetical protein
VTHEIQFGPPGESFAKGLENLPFNIMVLHLFCEEAFASLGRILK